MSQHSLRVRETEGSDIVSDSEAGTRHSDLRNLASRLESSLQSGTDSDQLDRLRAMLRSKKKIISGNPEPRHAQAALSHLAGDEAIGDNYGADSGATGGVGSKSGLVSRLSAPLVSGPRQALSAPSRDLDHIVSVLQERLSVAEKNQQALSRQIAEVLSRPASTGISPEIGQRLDGMQDSILKSTEEQTAHLSDSLKERVRQCEARSAEAINEMGTQVARVTERLQVRQEEILGSVDKAVAGIQSSQEENLKDVFERLNRRLEDAHRNSQRAIDPVQSTVSSLARRVDAIENDTKAGKAASPDGSGSGSMRAHAMSEGAAESGNDRSRQQQVSGQSVQVPGPGLAPAARYASAAASHVGGAAMPRYATAGIPAYALPAAPPQFDQRRMQDDAIRSARETVRQIQNDDQQPTKRFANLMEKRSKLPLMAVSALALAVAGGGGLTMMRGKPDAKADQSSPEKSLPDQRADTAPLEKERPPLSQETAGAPAENAPPIEVSILPQAAVEVTQSDGNAGRAMYERAMQDLAEGEKVLGAEHLTAAAGAGLAVAQYRLAKLYEKGEGVPRSIATARQWTEKAARNGTVNAMHDLAVFYAEGDGGLQNYALAAEWFGRAAQYGLVDSQYNLGVLHERGQGVTRSLEQAAFWYRRAGLSGDPDGARRADELGREAIWLDMKAIEARARAFVAKTRDPVANAYFDASRTGSASSASSAGSARGTRQAAVSSALVADVQNLLATLGYDPGSADGIQGSRTDFAVRAFQNAHQLPQTGRITPDLLQKLRTKVLTQGR